MIEKFITKQQLSAQTLEITKRLSSHGVPLDSWGSGKAKTIGHLAKEILEGETVLVDKNGEIIRRVELVHVDVRYTSNGTELQLVEDRQEFKDGRVRRRGLTGISEKMKPEENPVVSAKRALMEELGVNDQANLESLGTQEKTQNSPSYPGLTTEYLRHEMRTIMPNSAFKPEGYVENQSDKSTYFVWKEV